MGILTGAFFKYLSGGLAIGLIALSVYVFALRGDVRELTNWQDDIVLAVQGASGNDEVTEDSAKDQILAMGRSVENLRRGIETQNAAVDKLADERDAALHRAEVERARRQAAIDRARGTADDLDGQALTPADNPDEAMRAAQDQAYEEGL